MSEYIKREAVQEVLNKCSVGTQRDIPCYPYEIKLAAKAIKELQPADVAPVRHGCWQNRGIAMACSLCDTDLVIEQGTAEMNYCPNCGAKMDLKN